MQRFGALLAACVALSALSCGFLGGLGARPTVVVNLVLSTATVAAPVTPTALPSPTRAATTTATPRASATAAPTATARPATSTPTVRATSTTRPGPTGTPKTVSKSATPTARPVAAPAPPAGFEVVAFSLDKTANAEPIDPRCQFASGTERVYATYRWSGMTVGETWERQWYLNGELNTSGQGAWPTAGGRDFASLSGTPTLYEGMWEMRVVSGGRLLSRDYFVVGSEPPAFGVVTIAIGVDERFDLPIGEDFVFDEGVRAIYGIFPYSGFTYGTTWARSWFRDGQEELSKEAVWEDPSCAGANWVGIRDDDGLGAGTWELVLYIEGDEVQRTTFIIGSVLPVG